jgi:hypothetical protein
MRVRDVRLLQLLAYSAITLAAIAGIGLLAAGEIGIGVIVLVFAVLLGLAFSRVQRLIRRDVV